MEHLMHLHFLFAIHQVPLCGEVLASKMFAKLHVCLAVTGCCTVAEQES